MSGKLINYLASGDKTVVQILFPIKALRAERIEYTKDQFHEKYSTTNLKIL